MMEGHSEEVEQAIWRLHQAGEDLKSIVAKLKACDLYVSRKFISLAIRRGQLTVKMRSSLPVAEVKPTEEEPNISVSEDVLEEMEIDAGADKLKEASGIEVTVTEEDGIHETTDEVAGETMVNQEPELDALTILKPKARRIKTTDELILRIQEDFRERPDVKVKDRATKFGIAVGTLCQIKHSILKMPKESGRTWKSTPQMVGAIQKDIQEEPAMKVKERANKFGISVGTLCRIMHDILDMPKRVVQRSGGVRAPRTVSVTQPDGSVVKVPARKRPKRQLPTQLPQATMELSQQNITQLCLKSDSDGKVFVMRFDANGAAQMGEGSSGLAHVGNEEVIWVVNSALDEEEHVSEDVEAEPDDETSGVPDAESEETTAASP